MMRLQLPAVIRQNAPLKLVSLTVAVVLWLFVRVEEKGELVLRVPLRFTNVAENVVLVRDALPEVQVVVDGPRTLLAQAERSVRPYTIDLSETPPGHMQVRILPERFTVPRGVNVVRVVPSVVEVELQPVQRHRLPVQARLVGNVAEGYEIAGVDIEPSEIEITVAEGELADAEALRTEPVTIENLQDDWSGTVGLNLEGLHLKSITTRQVDVFVEISAKIVERSFSNIPVEVRPQGTRWRPQPTQVDIVTMGPERQLDRLDPETLRAVVDAEALAGESPESGVPYVVDLPDDVVLMRSNPDKIRLRR